MESIISEELVTKIAHAVKEAQKRREESYINSESNPDFGRYALTEEQAYISAFSDAGLSTLAYPFSLAQHWCNDLEMWCDAVISGKVKEYVEGMRGEPNVDAAKEKGI